MPIKHWLVRLLSASIFKERERNDKNAIFVFESVFRVGEDGFYRGLRYFPLRVFGVVFVDRGIS